MERAVGCRGRPPCSRPAARPTRRRASRSPCGAGCARRGSCHSVPPVGPRCAAQSSLDRRRAPRPRGHRSGSHPASAPPRQSTCRATDQSTPSRRRGRFVSSSRSERMGSRGTHRRAGTCVHSGGPCPCGAPCTPRHCATKCIDDRRPHSCIRQALGRTSFPLRQRHLWSPTRTCRRVVILLPHPRSDQSCQGGTQRQSHSRRTPPPNSHSGWRTRRRTRPRSALGQRWEESAAAAARDAGPRWPSSSWSSLTGSKSLTEAC